MARKSPHCPQQQSSPRPACAGLFRFGSATGGGRSLLHGTGRADGASCSCPSTTGHRSRRRSSRSHLTHLTHRGHLALGWSLTRKALAGHAWAHHHARAHRTRGHLTLSHRPRWHLPWWHLSGTHHHTLTHLAVVHHAGPHLTLAHRHPRHGTGGGAKYFLGECNFNGMNHILVLGGHSATGISRHGDGFTHFGSEDGSIGSLQRSQVDGIFLSLAGLQGKGWHTTATPCIQSRCD